MHILKESCLGVNENTNPLFYEYKNLYQMYNGLNGSYTCDVRYQSWWYTNLILAIAPPTSFLVIYVCIFIYKYKHS